MLEKALGMLGFRSSGYRVEPPDHRSLMRSALERVETARQMMREARSLEELDLARAALQQAQAEVQHVIRSAKRERGVTVRPIAETERAYQNLWARLKGVEEERSAGRRHQG